MDDMSRISMDINGEDFAASEQDIFITDSSDDLKIRQTIEGLSQAYVQNGGSLTLPIKVLRSDSITQMAKLIEEEELAMQKRQQEAEDKKLQSNEAMQKAVLEDKQADRDLEYYKIDTEANTKLAIANTNTPEGDDSEKLNLDRQKHQDDVALKEKDLSLKDRQLQEVKRHNIQTEKISKIQKQTKPSK